MSRTAKTLYERNDVIKQAKKDIKPGLAFGTIANTAFLIFSLGVDLVSIFTFEDLILRMNETLAMVTCVGFVFCIDILIPLLLTKLIKTHFNQKKLNLIFALSIFLSMGFLLLILGIQRVLGANIMIPDRGTTVVISQSVKIVTSLLLTFVPIATTVGLTVMGLLRENIKIYRKFRYIEIAEADATAEKEHIEEAFKNDNVLGLVTLRERDDSKFVSTITQLFAMQNTLFSRSREYQALNIGSPAATEQIINSSPVYTASEQYNYLKSHIMLNPAINVVFVDKEKNKSENLNWNVSINKEEIYNEKESI